MTPPFVTYDAHRGVWLLERDFHARPSTLAHAAIVIPGGFETDLSSVPRPLWNIAAPFELSIGGAITHDWLYRHGGNATIEHAGTPPVPGTWTFTRPEADRFFLDFMQEEGVSWLKRQVAYRAVRLFGGSSWQGASR